MTSKLVKCPDLSGDQTEDSVFMKGGVGGRLNRHHTVILTEFSNP